jgi:ribulose-phosphate 3-epimerase
MVLLMSVNPGFGGQEFISHTIEKVKALRNMIDNENPDCLIEVDGGVNYETGRLLIESGVDVLVAGSFVFNSENPGETISKLKRL